MEVFENVFKKAPKPAIPEIEEKEKTKPTDNNKKPNQEYKNLSADKKRKEKNINEDKGTIIDEKI